MDTTIQELNQKLIELRKEQYRLIEEAFNKLEERYNHLIGQKVVVRNKHRFDDGYSSHIIYYAGFQKSHTDIIMREFLAKKDGSISKRVAQCAFYFNSPFDMEPCENKQI